MDNYLYEEIRVKGGAYGYGASFGLNGSMYFQSYRDPHVSSTFEIFRKTAEYVSTIDLSQSEIEKYILGTIRGYDRPQSNQGKGMRAITYHMLGITDEMRQKERDEILFANINDIRKLSQLIASSVAQNNICAVGSEGALTQNRDLFGNIRKI